MIVDLAILRAEYDSYRNQCLWPCVSSMGSCIALVTEQQEFGVWLQLHRSSVIVTRLYLPLPLPNEVIIPTEILETFILQTLSLHTLDRIESNAQKSYPWADPRRHQEDRPVK